MELGFENINEIYTYRHGGFHFNINLSIIFIYINKGLHDCFQNDYEHLFDVPQHPELIMMCRVVHLSIG